MKSGVVSKRVLDTTGRWDAKYNLQIKDRLDEQGVPDTVENVQSAMAHIKDRDTATKAAANEMRAQARSLEEEARKLDQDAELTFPLRVR